MLNLKLPDQYDTGMSIRETEVAIKLIKDFFERDLSEALALTRVSAPLFVSPDSGLNDNLNGIERPVTFGIKELDDAPVEIVHSLAKWKRMALKRYGFCKGEGLYTDMNAIRRDEDTDNLHSIYVDQWDWEKIIGKEERTIDTLKTGKSDLRGFKAYGNVRRFFLSSDQAGAAEAYYLCHYRRAGGPLLRPHHKRTGAPNREGARRGVPDGNRRGVEKRKAS